MISQLFQIHVSAVELMLRGTRDYGRDPQLRSAWKDVCVDGRSRSLKIFVDVVVR